jgi:hypothetical protein
MRSDLREEMQHWGAEVIAHNRTGPEAEAANANFIHAKGLYDALQEPDCTLP